MTQINQVHFGGWVVGCVHIVLSNMVLVNWTCTPHIPKDHLLPFFQLEAENSQLLRVSPAPWAACSAPAGSCGVQQSCRHALARQPCALALGELALLEGSKFSSSPEVPEVLKQIPGSVFDFGRLTGCLWNVTGFQLQVGLSGLATGVTFKFHYKLASFC